MKLSFFCLVATVTAAVAQPTVYLIRHGEKPANDNDHMLSSKGRLRAQYLRKVFGPDSQYNIGHVMAETPKSNGYRQRPYDTVAPLAKELGLEVDTSCGKSDIECVKDVVDAYDGEGNILICWEHKRLSDIAEELGAKQVENYPSDRFDLIWTDPYPYGKITSITSENCAGLDD